MSLRTVADVLRSLPRRIPTPTLPRPPAALDVGGPDVFFAVETFRRHMTDEAWQLQIGAEHAGYKLIGKFLADDRTDVRQVLQFPVRTAVLQDKREWDANRAGCFDTRVAFANVAAAAAIPTTFRLTVHKDLQNDPGYNHAFHREWNPHAWLIYYHPRIAKQLCPWLRSEHLIRIYHTIDADQVPAYSADRPGGCLLSGRLQAKTYPLRTRVAAWATAGKISHTAVLEHPGYHAAGSCSNDYLRTLSHFRVAVCCSSIYGYSLRKLIEATACGCRVITDLPVDDVLPGIDDNLIRVSSDIGDRQMTDVIRDAIYEYDPDLQEARAAAAKRTFDFRVQGKRMAAEIAAVRAAWVGPQPTAVPRRAPQRPVVSPRAPLQIRRLR